MGQMGNQNSSGVIFHSSFPNTFDFKNLKPDIYLTQEEITRLQAIHRANIEYRRQSVRLEQNPEITREINALGDEITSRLNLEIDHRRYFDIFGENFSTPRETVILLLQRFIDGQITLNSLTNG